MDGFDGLITSDLFKSKGSPHLREFQLGPQLHLNFLTTYQLHPQPHQIHRLTGFCPKKATGLRYFVIMCLGLVPALTAHSSLTYILIC